MSSVDEHFMQIALKEAKKAIGRTSPNPCVGAVIVKDGGVIATGYHKKAGTPHAEIHAIDNGRGQTDGTTIYVTLEPCNHTGKTPPCTEAIVKAGCSKVVIGMTDPNPLVDGAGIAYLQSHGIEVVQGVLEEQCIQINKPFIKRITTGLPLVAMKAGVSIDGKINYVEGESGWITGAESLRKVHLLRNQFDGILVGRGTLEIDDPSLTTRLSGKRGRDPQRLVIDSTLKISSEAKILKLDSPASTHIFYTHAADEKIKQLDKAGAILHRVKAKKGAVDLEHVLQKVSSLGMNSILVEGGATIHGNFLYERLVDEVYMFMAPVFAGDLGIPVIAGVSSSSRENSIRIVSPQYKKLGEDMLLHGQVVYPK